MTRKGCKIHPKPGAPEEWCKEAQKGAHDYCRGCEWFGK